MAPPRNRVVTPTSLAALLLLLLSSSSSIFITCILFQQLPTAEGVSLHHRPLYEFNVLEVDPAAHDERGEEVLFPSAPPPAATSFLDVANCETVTTEVECGPFKRCHLKANMQCIDGACVCNAGYCASKKKDSCVRDKTKILDLKCDKTKLTRVVVISVTVPIIPGLFSLSIDTKIAEGFIRNKNYGILGEVKVTFKFTQVIFGFTFNIGVYIRGTVRVASGHPVCALREKGGGG